VNTYDPSLTLEAARKIYFEKNGFGDGGGYDAAWVDFKLGPIPFPFPNTAPRVRAVRYHDLHHIVTGYETSFVGELEISAWEIGSGCADMAAAWYLNLGGMGFGALIAPRKVWRAFVLGRTTANFYREPFDAALLSRTIGEARATLGLDTSQPRAGARDWLLWSIASSFGLAIGLVSLVLLAPLAAAAALPLRWLRARNA
jgi:hypothetical protein